MSSFLARGVTPLTLALLCVAGWFWSEAWQFNRSLMTSEGWLPAQWWRIVSSQFAHRSGSHLLGNLAAIALVAWVAPAWLNRQVGLALAIYLVVGVGVVTWFAQPDVVIYRGFSGVGHGWLLIGLAWTPYLGPWLRMLALTVLYGKVIWEGTDLYLVAQSWGYNADLSVLTDVHWYGVLLALPIGIAAFVVRFLQDRSRLS